LAPAVVRLGGGALGIIEVAPSVAERPNSRQLVKDLIYQIMNLDLSEDETTALARLLRNTIDKDRYTLSPRIRTLQGILDKLVPPAIRESLPPPKVYAPPRATAARRRRRG
jgi:hypothetical protein